MRGKLDLGSHKLAGVYRVPARRSYRKRMPKMPGGNKGVYFMLWRLVDGAVADCIARHPDYLTAKGKNAARLSINKRVVGALMGYASQAPALGRDAKCRSVGREGAMRRTVDAPSSQAQAPCDAAADMIALSYGSRNQPMTSSANVIAGARLYLMRLWRALTTARPKFTGMRHD